MSRRFVQRQADPEFRNRVLTLVFGAIPATFYCGFAVLALILGLIMLPSPFGFLMVLLGGAGALGTYSLWMIVFGFWSRLISYGLVTGIVAMLPFLIFPRLAFDISASWVGSVASFLLKVSPVCVALVWLSLSSRTTYRAPRTLREMVWSSIAVLASLAVPALAIFAPVWATPIARLWYETGFEENVAEALAEIGDSESACIYDDGLHMFVTSIDQLDAGGMIERAVQDKSPRPRLRVLQRDPHFRVYSGGHTYYWSFRDKKLYPFRGNRWTLAPRIEKSCSAYRQNPASFQRAYMDREGIAVTEDNFCCSTKSDSQP